VSAPSFVVANPRDSVATATEPLPAGAPIPGGVLLEPIPAGHKFALRAHAPGESVVKLGQPIGTASAAIAVGAHVHVHNLAFDGRANRAERGVDLRDPPRANATFEGYVRADGRVGTRNHLGIITSVNCSATVARKIAAHFTPERLAAYPNVDGVCAFAHTTGCGMAKDGVGLANLRRTLAGYATHPNFAGMLVVGLGCEVNQIDGLLADAGLQPAEMLRTLGIQDSGGTRAAIDAGIAQIEAMLPIANLAVRTTVDASHLVVGLQCGGSDGYSGLTANPALGVAADRLVAAGGRVVLSETPEIYGAENLLLRRAATPAAADKLIERLQWWEAHAQAQGADLDNNPSPGNKAGGITTILEKSLGAVAKSGSTPLRDVIDYAAPIVTPGLTFMDTPGYDPCSATGQIAGGANLIVFTTGRGAVFGSKPAPTLKLASNSTLARKMADDVDVDCGRIATGDATHAQVGDEIFAAMLAAASGRRTKSEENGLGDEEFVPWVTGVVF
jgi:altronate hydrolase